MKFVNESVDDILKPKSKEEISAELEKIIQDNKFFTVGDLKKKLENFPDELPVGRAGHFGEFLPQDEDDIYVWNAYPVPINKSWRDAPRINMPILQFASQNPGPDPD
jgi:hypothetical protein